MTQKKTEINATTQNNLSNRMETHPLKDETTVASNFKADSSKELEGLARRIKLNTNSVFDQLKRNNLALQVEKIQNNLTELQNDILESSKNFRYVNELSSIHTKLKKDAENIQGKINDLSKSIDAKENDIASFKKSIREELKLDASKKLWKDRSASASRSYIISNIIICAMIFLPILTTAYYLDDIISIFNKVNSYNQDNSETNSVIIASTLSRLVIVTIPIMLYIWLIRIVVRFNMRSLLLKDDADQRNTMLETYLHLTEMNKADITERPLILEALFRRAPGHGADTIETPNLTDILRLSETKKI